MKNLLIIGAGGFARETKWLLDEINRVNDEWRFIGYLDKNSKTGCTLNGFKVYTTIEEVISLYDDIYSVCAIGNPALRRKVINKAKKYNIKFATLIHPNVLRDKNVLFGEGCIICAGNIFTTNIKVGNHVIFNLGCTIGHDAVINDFTTILPCVSISGNVTIDEEADIGTKVAIIQGKSVGKNTVIGAGAVIINDIPSNCTAVGIPAKAIKIN